MRNCKPSWPLAVPTIGRFSIRFLPGLIRIKCSLHSEAVAMEKVLTVSKPAGASLPPKLSHITGYYKPSASTLKGSEVVLSSQLGAKLYFRAGFWYFDSLRESCVAWAEGRAEEVPLKSWKAPSENLFMAMIELPLILQWAEGEPMKTRGLSAKPGCGDGCKIQMANCSAGIKRKLAKDEVGNCCSGVKKTIGKHYSEKSAVVQKHYSKVKDKAGQHYTKFNEQHLPVVKGAIGDAHAAVKSKAYEHYETIRDVHAPLVKQKTSEYTRAIKEKANGHYETLRDVHAPLIKKKTGEVAAIVRNKTKVHYEAIRDEHAPLAAKKTRELASKAGEHLSNLPEYARKVRDVHAPYAAQKAREHYEAVRDVHAPLVKKKTQELAVLTKEHAKKHASACHGFCSGPVVDFISAHTVVTRRKTGNVFKACARGVVYCIVDILDKVLDVIDPHHFAALKLEQEELEAAMAADETSASQQAKTVEDIATLQDGADAIAAGLTLELQKAAADEDVAVLQDGAGAIVADETSASLNAAVDEEWAEERGVEAALPEREEGESLQSKAEENKVEAELPEREVSHPMLNAIMEPEEQSVTAKGADAYDEEKAYAGEKISAA